VRIVVKKPARWLVAGASSHSETRLEPGTPRLSAVGRAARSARVRHQVGILGLRLPTSRDNVARSRYAKGGSKCGESRGLAGTSSDGEIRTRTGDTTIFRESAPAIRGQERPANPAVFGIGALIQCPRIGAVSCRFGTSSGPRSPNQPRLRCQPSLARGPCGGRCGARKQARSGRTAPRGPGRRHPATRQRRSRD
jgi:hypothetical protein